MPGPDGENIRQNQVGSHRVRREQFAEVYMVYLDIYNTMVYNCGDRAPSIF